jgi:hypothetical protein
MLTVQWIKSTAGDWLSFSRVDLSNVTAQGVYVIWQVGRPPQVIRVGQGDIAARLRAHRSDPKLGPYSFGDALRVTWASVPVLHRDGVERFLASQYSPLVGDAFPNVAPIRVNLVA